MRPDNNFDLLRWLAASMVIVSHHFYLIGKPPPAWLPAGMLGGVAVMIFFTISGYWVTLSWQRRPHLATFATKRFFRIWPGLAVAVFIDVILIGTMGTRLPLHDYFTHPQTLAFLKSLLLIPTSYDLPGIFLQNPYPEVVNGPLWTLPMEALCYLILAVLGALGLLRRRVTAAAAALVFIGYFLVFNNTDHTGRMDHWIEYSTYFACGTLIATFNASFKKHGRITTLTAVGLFIVLFFFTPLQHTAALIALPPVLVYVGSQLRALAPGFNRLGDPSYGMYIYGYPSAQIVYALAPTLHFGISLAITLAIAHVLGYASWHCVEKRALYWSRRLTEKPSGTPGVVTGGADQACRLPSR